MQIGTYKLDTSRVALMGVVNVTPDSFSDGGKFYNADLAISHALKLIKEGADILDIGGESTRPGADHVTESQELERVIPVIEGVRKVVTAPISIDTTKAKVAEAAIEAGADMINDISAGHFDKRMLQIAAESDKPICLMHMQGTPRDMQNCPKYGDLIGEIKGFLLDAVKRAVTAGVRSDNIILDPGIGFGKSAADNIEILKRLRKFIEIGYPVLVGTSKKSFIGKMLSLDVKDRLEATLATIPPSIAGGASILRLHDILSARRFLDMYYFLQ